MSDCTPKNAFNEASGEYDYAKLNKRLREKYPAVFDSQYCPVCAEKDERIEQLEEEKEEMLLEMGCMLKIINREVIAMQGYMRGFEDEARLESEGSDE